MLLNYVKRACCKDCFLSKNFALHTQYIVFLIIEITNCDSEFIFYEFLQQAQK